MKQERYPITSITDVELEAIVRAIEGKEPAAKVGYPRHYSHLSLLRFHVYRSGKGGLSVRRMLRELRRDKRLMEILAIDSIPSLSTISERSKRLSWQELWRQEGGGTYFLDNLLFWEHYFLYLYVILSLDRFNHKNFSNGNDGMATT